MKYGVTGQAARRSRSAPRGFSHQLVTSSSVFVEDGTLCLVSFIAFCTTREIYSQLRLRSYTTGCPEALHYAFVAQTIDKEAPGTFRYDG